MFHSRLRVRVGPSMDKLVCITDKVNSGKAHDISSELFEGKVAINIKGFTNPTGEELSAEYFDREDRKGITWSIQVQGRFLQANSADDIMFGNTFDKRLKLPWGAGVALKFMKYVDASLEHDLMSETKPWALSPLIATMPYFVHERLDDVRASPLLECKRSEFTAPSFPPSQSIGEDTSQLQFAIASSNSSSSTFLTSSSSNSPFLTPYSSLSSISPSATSSSSNLSRMPGSLGASVKKSLKLPLEKSHLKMKKQKSSSLDLRTTSGRRSYFSSPQHRQEIVFGPEDQITTDFCYGYLQFNPTLALRLPGGMSFDLMKYWDRHPVRFVCCKRRKPEDKERRDGQPTGDIFWIVSIETTDESDVHQEDSEDI